MMRIIRPMRMVRAEGSSMKLLTPLDRYSCVSLSAAIPEAEVPRENGIGQCDSQCLQWARSGQSPANVSPRVNASVRQCDEIRISAGLMADAVVGYDERGSWCY